jgi:hypothetical protein
VIEAATELYVMCCHCIHVFKLNYEPKNADNWWCPECKERVRDDKERRRK